MGFRTTTRVRHNGKLIEADKPITFGENDAEAQAELLACKAVEGTGKDKPGGGEASEPEA